MGGSAGVSSKSSSRARGSRLGALILLLFVTLASGGHRDPPPAECPQPRFTGRAPAALYERINPLPASRANLRAGRDLYHELLQPACADCHGARGAGNGPLASQFDPTPRNFACRQTVNGIPDGQLHWIIENGSPATAMPSFGFLSDDEIWQLVHYLRSLANDH